MKKISTSLLASLMMLGLISSVEAASDRTNNRGTWSQHFDRCAETSDKQQEGCFYHGEEDYPWRQKKVTAPTTTNFDWREGLQVIFGLGDE